MPCREPPMVGVRRRSSWHWSWWVVPVLDGLHRLIDKLRPNHKHLMSARTWCPSHSHRDNDLRRPFGLPRRTISGRTGHFAGLRSYSMEQS